MTERPGTWQRVRTNSGYHLRLIGANGEPVLTSEVYTRPETAAEALGVALDAARYVMGIMPLHRMDPEELRAHRIRHALVDVDERGTGPGPHTTATTLKARIAAVLDDAYDPDDYGLRLDQIRTIIQD